MNISFVIDFLEEIKGEEIIWKDNPEDPVLVVTKVKRKKDPRDWYYLYDLNGETFPTGKKVSFQPIIKTLNLSYIENYVRKLECGERPTTLIEMRKVIVGQKKGPLLIDYKSNENIEPRASLFYRENLMKLRGPEKYMPSAIAHEAGHFSQEEKVWRGLSEDFDNYIKVVESEEDAWKRAIPGMVELGTWDEDSHNMAIHGLASYYTETLNKLSSEKYYCKANECTVSRSILNYMKPRYNRLAEIIANEYAEKVIDELVETGEIKEVAEERIYEMHDKIMENFPDVDYYPKTVKSTDIFEFIELPIGWTVIREEKPIHIEAIDDEGEIHTVDQEYRYTVYDNLGNQLSSDITEEGAVARSKKQYWDMFPWEAPENI